MIEIEVMNRYSPERRTESESELGVPMPGLPDFIELESRIPSLIVDFFSLLEQMFYFADVEVIY